MKNLEDKNAAITGENAELQKVLNTIVARAPLTANQRRECSCDLCDGIYSTVYSIDSQPVVIGSVIVVMLFIIYRKLVYINNSKLLRL